MLLGVFLGRNYDWFKIYKKCGMITTRLKRQCTAKGLLLQFSASPLPPALQQFYRACKEEGVQVRRDKLNPNEVNFYSVLSSAAVEVRGVRLETTPQDIKFIFTVLYISSETDEEGLELTPPQKRTILLRQGLDPKFYFQYQFQNTQSQLESVIFLCELSSTIINCQAQQKITFYDQKSEQIKANAASSARETLWKNIFYQIPGLGKEKCHAIALKYPSYQSLLQDYNGRRELKNVGVSRGIKQMKLGSVLANRIYRCLFVQEGSSPLFDQ